MVAYAELPALTDPNLQQRQLHALLVEDVADLQGILQSESHPSRAPFAAKLSRYGRALSVDIAQIDPVVLWKAGNGIRLLLIADAALKSQMVNEPTLDPVAHAMLQDFVATHNNFAALHPDMAPLERNGIDPADAHKPVADPALLQEAIDTILAQTRLIVEEVRLDLQDLHLQARGQNEAAIRALHITQDSLENLIKVAVAQALIEARGDSFPSQIVGDIRSSVVSAGVSSAITAAATVGPTAAASYVQMVYGMSPDLPTLLASLQGQGGTLAQTVEHLVARVKLALRKP